MKGCYFKDFNKLAELFLGEKNHIRHKLLLEAKHFHISHGMSGGEFEYFF